MKSIVSYIVLIVLATGILFAMVHTKHSVDMEITDRGERLQPNGEKLVIYCVRVSDYDTALCKSYASTIFHKDVTDSESVNMPIQMNFFFYKEENLLDLSGEEVRAMSRGDAKTMARLRKLAVDTSGFGVVRFSDVYSLFGRDSMYTASGRMDIPRYGIQLNDFLRPPTSKE